MSNNKNKQAALNAARKKSLEERLAAQQAAEQAAAKALKRKRYTIGGIALGSILVIISIIIIATAGGADGVQTRSTVMTAAGSSDITVEVDVPVKWTITGASEDLGCMDGVSSQFFGLQSVSRGKKTTVSFTPASIGSYTVYCSHGVKVNTIKVV
jgi:plastocyanin domain-containing protein